MTYQIAPNFNNAAGLQVIVPYQPKSQGIVFPEYRKDGFGNTYVNGRSLLTWTIEVLRQEPGLSFTEYEDLLTLFGLSIAPEDVSAEVTVRTIGYDRNTFANFNARVTHRKGVDTDHNMGLYRLIIFTFERLVAI